MKKTIVLFLLILGLIILIISMKIGLVILAQVRQLAWLTLLFSTKACSSLHYKLGFIFNLFGGFSLSFWRIIASSGSGAVTQRNRISTPFRVGRTTSTNWSFLNSSMIFRGSSPSPACRHIRPKHFHKTYAKKQTKIWAWTRFSF